MTDPALSRPPRVTTACLFMGLTCVIVLFSIGSMLSNWGSIEVQDQVRTMLASEPLRGSGLSVTEVMGWLRWALLGAAAVAATGIVFAIYTAKGHQASRVILTVMCGLSALIFLAGGLFGLLPGAFSIGCGIYLWTAESRRWFALKNGKVLVGDFETPRSSAPGSALDTASAPGSAAAAARQPRPGSVSGAGLTALIASALVALVCGINAIGYAVAKSEYVRAVADQPLMHDVVQQTGLSPAGFARALFIGCTIATVLSIMAVLAAIGTLQGHGAARTVLQALSIITLPVSIVTFPVGLLWSAAAIAVLVLLKRPESRQWMR